MVIQQRPILLAASTTLSTGGSALFDAAKLQRQERAHCVIHEIVFMIDGIPIAGSASTSLPSIGGVVRANIDVGSFPLTRGFTPLWSLATCPQEGNIRAADTVPADPEIAFSKSTAGADKIRNQYRWLLPRPLFVPGGTAFDVALQWVNDVATVTYSNLTVWVGIRGYALQPGTPIPSKISVPFATAFVVNEEGLGLVSDALRLVNPFPVPLNVQRFIGRIQTTKPGWITEANSMFNYDEAALSLRLADSQGYDLIRVGNGGSTPWGLAFDQNRRAWTSPRILDSHEWYSATVGPLTNPTTSKPMLSMVGYREEETANA